jgi:hypothetical protein
LTIVVALKVGDGLVLGADSATTFFDNKGAYHNSYFNGEKLFNLAKALPIGAVTYGLGSLQGHSIGFLAKEFRARNSDPSNSDWYLDPKAYTVQDAVDRFKAYFFDELYVKQYPALPVPPPGGSAPPAASAAAPSTLAAVDAPAKGFLIAGYGPGKACGEIWRIDNMDGSSHGPVCAYDDGNSGGAVWQGQTEAGFRLLLGYSPAIVQRLTAAGMTEQDATNLLQSAEQVIQHTMPIQDAIDLVHFLLDVTAGYVRFAPGPATVAKPFDLAAITRHEGFRWVLRKHYYPRELNLPHPTGGS